MNHLSLALLVYLSLFLNALGQDSIDWMPIYQGIDYKLDTISTKHGNVRIHSTRVDLQNPSITFAVTPPEQEGSAFSRAQKPSTFLREKGAQVAANGLAFAPPTLADEGDLVMAEGSMFSNGKMYSATPAVEDAALLFLKDGSAKIVTKGDYAKYIADVKEGMGGWSVRGFSSQILKSGDVNPDLIVDELAARTAACLSEDGSHLYLTVAESGPRKGIFWFKDKISTGVYLSELGEYMKGIGCYNAINFDGGGASTMVLEDNEKNPFVVNLPSDYRVEGERAVGSHLAIYSEKLQNSVGRENINLVKEASLKFAEKKAKMDRHGLADNYLYFDTNPAVTPIENFSQDSCSVDIANEYINIANLIAVASKDEGKSAGGIYRDKSDLVWFLKQGQAPVNEYTAAKLMNLFIGSSSGNVKLVYGNRLEGVTGSRQMLDFRPESKLNNPLKDASYYCELNSEEQQENTDDLLDHYVFSNEANMYVLLDFLGVGDRHPGNQGYVIDESTGIASAARIDYDNAFIFTGKKRPNDSEALFLKNPESMKYFTETIIEFGLVDSFKAFEEVTAMPDEVLQFTITRAVNSIQSLYVDQPIWQKYSGVSAALVRRKMMMREVMPSIRFLINFIDAVQQNRASSYDQNQVEWHAERVFGHKDGLLTYATRFSMGNVVNFLLEQYGQDINVKLTDGRSAIHWMARRGNSFVFDQLINRGMNITLDDDYGRSGLFYAAQKGRATLAEAFLKHLPEKGINQWDYEGRTALHAAVANLRLNIFNMLLSKGADVNFRDSKGRTPIFYSLKKGREIYFDALLENGCDVNIRDLSGRTPLHFAAKQGLDYFIERLIECGVDVNTLDNKGKTAAHYAAEAGRLATLRLLESEKADLVVKDNVGKTPAHYVAGTKHLRAFEFFANREGGLVADDQNRTPIFYAAAKGQLTTIMESVSRGLDIESFDIRGMRPLHFAAGNGHGDVVKYLFMQGAMLDSQDNAKRTPLHHAVGKRRLEIVKYLLAKGADPYITDKSGRKPLDLAEELGYNEIIKVLRAH